MRLKNIPGSREAIAGSKYVIKGIPAMKNCDVVPSGQDVYKNCTTDPGEKDSASETFENDLRGKDWSVKGHWAGIFGNKNPIRIEIGMGKGMFIMEQARRNPGVNFVGIEKYSSVLLRAVQKQDAECLPNVHFLRMEAEYIENVFAPDEVDRIYLNFSDPWPKKKNAKRRLTSRQFLTRYENILKPGGLIEFKTDNVSLFDFSLEELLETGACFMEEAFAAAEFPDELLNGFGNTAADPAGISAPGSALCAASPAGFSSSDAPGPSRWLVLAVTRDLHASPMNEGNIMTEYETRFSAEGNKICKYIIKKSI